MVEKYMLNILHFTFVAILPCTDYIPFMYQDTVLLLEMHQNLEKLTTNYNNDNDQWGGNCTHSRTGTNIAIYRT